MAGTTSLRKSSRLTKGAEGVNVQSRITEFVNVRKRAAGFEQQTMKKIEEIEVSEKRESSVVLTPVKNKRKLAKGAASAAVVEEVKKSGVLTPSPSLESVNETKQKNVEVEKVQDATEIKVPAYKRFAHLVEGVRNQKPKLNTGHITESVTERAIEHVTDTKPVPVPVATDIGSSLEGHKFVPWLPLNEKWSIYEKIIFNVDNLCVLAAGRSQPCVFHKIQKTLENVIGRQVPLEQMEKLKTLWPEAYEYRESRVVMQGKRIESVALGVPGLGGTDSSAALMNERKEHVRGRVQKYLINAHRELFAKEANEVDIPKEWHSKFDQNAVAELPRTPLIGSEVFVAPERCSTPKLINDIMSSTVTSSAASTIASSVNTPTAKASNLNSTTVIPAKLSLLERIREKEQKLQAQRCFGVGVDSETVRLEAILSQMDRFTQSVMFTFSSAKKTTLFLTDLTSKLVQSSATPLSYAEVLERLKLLERAAPDWIKIVEDGEVTPKHVKILDKTRSLNSILENLKTMKRN